MFKFLSYIRAILLIPFIAFWTAIWSIFVIISIFVLPRETVAWIICRIWADFLLFICGVKIEVRGIEHFPMSRGGLCLFNHTSHFDILAMFSKTPRFCYFGAKSELFKIPFFGPAMTALGALRIERNNRAKVIQIYRDAESRAAQGDVFALAPEGTRQKGLGYLGDFKSGPFFFAVNSKMPVIPLVMAGCEVVLPKHSLFVNWGKWNYTVVFEFLQPIYPDESLPEDEQVKLIKEKTRQAMAGALQKIWANKSY